ncbi:MAG: transcriptional repressor NrdR [Chloroflexi bacterium]|nr:transcriptional repressor NrdR [Chloroflexota bacterium]
MICPYCGFEDSRVVDTRDIGRTIRRRRECRRCGKRFTTYEQVALTVSVVKRDGRREPFDREKVMRGLRIACAKRPIPTESIERIVDRVEEFVFSQGKAEIPSRDIGNLVLEQLRQVDPVAYIRFATVYLQLPDLDAVRREIDRLITSGSG